MVFIIIGIVGFLIGWLFCSKILHHREVHALRKELGFTKSKGGTKQRR